MNAPEAQPDTRAFALAVLRRTREAWLPGASSRRGLNGTPASETKRVCSASGAPCAAEARGHTWASILVASAIVLAVVAGELWAVRAGPGLDATAVRGIVGGLSIAVERVAEAARVGPVD